MSTKCSNSKVPPTLVTHASSTELMNKVRHFIHVHSQFYSLSLLIYYLLFTLLCTFNIRLTCFRFKQLDVATGDPPYLLKRNKI